MHVSLQYMHGRAQATVTVCVIVYVQHHNVIVQRFKPWMWQNSLLQSHPPSVGSFETWLFKESERKLHHKKNYSINTFLKDINTKQRVSIAERPQQYLNAKLKWRNILFYHSLTALPIVIETIQIILKYEQAILRLHNEAARKVRRNRMQPTSAWENQTWCHIKFHARRCLRGLRLPSNRITGGFAILLMEPNVKSIF